MKKILALVLFLFLCCAQTSHAALFTKKKETAVVPTGSGYVGTLPDVTERFQKSQTEEAKPSFDYQDGFNDQNSLKPVPRDNPAFVNIIMKKDKTSQYVNDLNSIIPIVEKLQTIIEEQDNVQVFNAESYFLKTNVEYFRDKYKNKAEQSYISYKKLAQLNTHVQSVAQLRLDSEAQSPYITAEQSGNSFTQNNINNQLDYLLDDIKSTLVVLKETR